MFVTPQMVEVWKNANSEIWITEDGRTIPIREMTDDHLKNAVSMLDRKARSIRMKGPFPVCTSLNKEIKRRMSEAQPWKDEPDEVRWTSEVGYECFMLRTPLGSWCAYVAIPKGHPLYEKRDLDCFNELSVHGGVTYVGETVRHLACEGHLLVGFDCAHGGDLMPYIFGEDVPIDPVFQTDCYRDLVYVQMECESLARQLSTLR